MFTEGLFQALFLALGTHQLTKETKKFFMALMGWREGTVDK